jgi:hypothetical protein
MGFIRGTAITLFSIILLISLLLMNLTLLVSWSMHHDIFKPAIKNSAIDLLNHTVGVENMFTEEERTYMDSYCLIDSQYNFTYEDYSMIIPCQVIEQGPDSIIEYGADNFIDEVYYAEYNCELWDCVGNSSFPLVLFSEKARDYWRAKFLLLVAISIALFALIFFISRNRTTTFIVTGILIILSSLPFRELGWVLNLLPSEFSGILSAFFAKSHTVFIIMLVIGIIFIIAGILFKIFGWKMKFNEDSSKENKEEIIKKDSSKSKQKKKN